MDSAKDMYWSSYMYMVPTSSHLLDKTSLLCVDSEYFHVKILNNHLSIPAKEYSY